MSLELEDQRIIVTGGAGFIGSHIVDILIIRGATVTVIDNFSTGKEENLLQHQDSPNLTIINGDLTNYSWLLDQIKDIQPDIIYHQAALVSVQESNEKPLFLNQNNITNTLHILEAARTIEVPKIVYASSSAVYGDLPGQPKKETMPIAPLSPYGVTKLSSESYMQAYFKVYGIPTVSLRYFNVYGPRQSISPYGGVIAIFIQQIIKNKNLIIYGAGSQLRDFIYVKDVAKANLLAGIDSKVKGEILNVASGCSTSITDLAHIIMNLCNFQEPCIFEDERSGDIFASTADISAIQKSLKWNPEFSLTQGLKETIRWYKTR